MFNNRAQTVNTGLDMPSGSLSQSDSKGIQMRYTQYMDSEKMAPIQQRTNNLEFMDVDYKPSICNVSHVDGVMASLETGLSSNFQGSSGLMRYHSAPSSFFSSLEDEENNNIISQYFSNDPSIPSQSNIKTTQQHQLRISASHLRENDLAKRHGECNEYLKRNAHQIPSLKRSAGHVGREDLGKHHHLGAILENGPDVPHDNFGTPQMSLMSPAQASHQGEQQMDSFQTNSVGCDSLGRMTNVSSLTSKNSLIRHSSSPAGLLSELVSDVQGAYEGYPDEKIRNGLGLGSSCGDILPPNRVQNQMNCLRQNSSPPGLLSQLSMEMGVRQIGERLNMPMVGSSAENQASSSSDDGSLGGGNLRQGYISNFQVGPWDDATMPSGELAGLQNGISFVARKRAKELDGSMMQGLHGTDAQVEAGNRGASALINRPYNLPRSTSAELAMDEFLQDSVPCKVRAKRGCATHPRSIAERVRRTRISERMRRLQELVPNSDKQTTNIADMLDEAVEYVKSLKKQVQGFTEERAKCTCIHRPDCAFKT